MASLAQVEPQRQRRPTRPTGRRWEVGGGERALIRGRAPHNRSSDGARALAPRRHALEERQLRLPARFPPRLPARAGTAPGTGGGSSACHLLRHPRSEHAAPPDLQMRRAQGPSWHPGRWRGPPAAVPSDVPPPPIPAPLPAAICRPWSRARPRPGPGPAPHPAPHVPLSLPPGSVRTPVTSWRSQGRGPNGVGAGGEAEGGAGP